MLRRAALLALCSAGVPVMAGGFTMSADNLDEYCFYSIYTTLSEYTFAGSVTIEQNTGGSSGHGDTSQGDSTSSSSSSTSHGSSSGTDSSSSVSHGDSQSSSSSWSSTSHGSGSDSDSTSADQTQGSTSHNGNRRMLLRRGHGGGGTSTGPCNSTVQVTSMYASAKAWCNKAQFAATIPYWQGLCEKNSLTLMNLSGIESNVTDAYIASLSVIDPDMNDTTTTGTIESPVLLSEEYYKRAYKSYVTHDYALSKDKRFGWGLIGYWGGILVLGMIAKFIGLLSSKRQASPDMESTGHQKGQEKKTWGILSKPMHLLQTYVVIPASFAPYLNNHQQLYFYHTIPRRLDLLIVFGFWALCILSYACLPFLWLFGGRNNIFLWATNFNSQSFNIFHRHVAWACTLLAIVHSINYSVVFKVYDGRFDSVWVQEYWYMGVVATILMSFMLVQSMTILRHKGYETFLIIHIVFAIVVVYALFRHTSFDGTKWNGYLWPMVAIWSFDRTVRLVRIAYCNLNVRLSGQISRTTKSKVEYFEDSDLVKVEIQPASSAVIPRPGQHYYLYQPVLFRGWENHPFTLGAWVPSTSSATQQVGSNNEKSQQGSKLIFYIRPYDGWTRRLRDQCRKASSKGAEAAVVTPKILLEGPYGHSASLHTFDTVLMIVGGTGIAAAVPYIIDHVSRIAECSTRVLRVKLIWAARTRQMYERVFAGELAGLLRDAKIDATVYCTGSKSAAGSPASETINELDAGTPPMPTPAPSMASRNSISASDPDEINTANITESKKEANIDVSQLGISTAPSTVGKSVKFCSGRPDVQAIITNEAQEARENSSRLAVLTCGPAQMADDCRKTVYEVMKGEFRDVEYFEEAFGW
ncbi:ferric reductase family protein [Aspergillus stella-maris]|uniref:ferric reductase family protein n=1 Tax=Aspergillus stella-maris TaxID=1810926 RepID=UPI003CCDD797